MHQSGLYLLMAPFAILLVAICLVFTLVNRRQLKSHWRLPFMVTTLLVIVFTVMELLATSERTLMLASHATYTFIVFLPIAWLLACTEYSDAFIQLKRPVTLAGLLVVPAFTVIFAWANGSFHLLWKAHEIVRDGPYLYNHVTHYGPWFWVYVTYAYGLYFAGTAFVFRGFLRQKGHQGPISIFGVATTAFPLAFNLLYVFRLIPGIHRDFSTLVFAPAALAFVIWSSREGITQMNASDDSMSRREEDVCSLLASGFSNKEIATRLCISENTVKTHTRHIYRKLAVTNRQELRDVLKKTP